MSKRGSKRVKGESVDWDELKVRHNINLTQFAWDRLKLMGDEMGGISRSEVIERLVRGLYEEA